MFLKEEINLLPEEKKKRDESLCPNQKVSNSNDA
jgi:hypothetical protein